MTINELFARPKIKSNFIKIWKRNFLFFQKHIWVSLFWIVFEPMMYLLALGYGLGSFVDNINRQSYIDFFFPGLVAMTSMMVPFFEGTYANYTKLTHQKLYTSVLLTPMGADEIVFGEILWSTTKGFIGVLGVLFISSFFGLVNTWNILLVLPVVFLIAWLFSSLAMVVTSMAKNYDSFIYATSGFIIPMTLISGVYYPMQQLPFFLQAVSYALPLSHGVGLMHGLMSSQLTWVHGLHLLYLLFFGWVLMNMALKKIKAKIIY
jgi:lipooligosaccharide transport system permease protein